MEGGNLVAINFVVLPNIRQGNRSSRLSAWPAVMLDFLRGQYDRASTGKPFHKVLPATIFQQQQYQHLFSKSG